MDAETTLPAETVIDQEIDIFTWTNNLTQHIDSLVIDVFFFSKNFVPYKVALGGEIERQLRAVFIDGIVDYVLNGLDKGLIVRGFEDAENEAGVLQKTYVANIDKFAYLQSWIEGQHGPIEAFVPKDMDITKMKGVMAYCHHPGLPQSFFIVKSLPSSQVMKGANAWLMRDDEISPFGQLSAVKIPMDNQLLVIDNDLFVFNQSKLKSLFGYDAKAAFVAQQKVVEIEEKFKLAFADGADLQSMVFGKPSTIKKLQKLDVEAVSQADILAHAEEMGVDLLTDELGAIIIMDDKDLVRFVNLINDDYVESGMTGQRYEIISKRPLKIKADEE